jgi:hypothetical protein
VQQKQFNFARQGWKLTLATTLLVVAWPAMAGSIVQPSQPDPLLNSGPTDPCAARADYAAGIDVNGQPVVPANVAARPVPVPDSIVVPIARNRTPESGRNFRRGSRPNRTSDDASNRDSSYIALDGRKLEPLLNPPPCGAVH